MRRKIYDQLVEWKKDRGRSCLTIQGQRQVGKTYIVEKFASENYEHFVSVNFAERPELCRIFEGDITVDAIVRELSIWLNGVNLEPGSTLIFFDEIQDCPRARTQLKGFALDGRYDVIQSGSLLGITNLNAKDASGNRHDGSKPLYPMGYEEILTLRSMDFEEFLWAIGFPEDVLEAVKRKIGDRQPLSDSEIQVLSSHFRDFMIVGGMPAQVRDFVEQNSYQAQGRQQDRIIGDLVGDINRYNSPIDARKTQKCLEQIPEQLGSGNKKFHYSRIDGGGSRASSEKYFENLVWIQEAGYGNFCYAVEQPQLPFRRIEGQFKVYLSDTGLLTRMMGRSAAMAIHEGRTDYNLGALMENEVAECITKCGYKLRYYRKNSGPGQMELDFVTELLDECAVIEVKSGRSRDAPSLSKAGRFFNVDRRIVFENGNIRSDTDGIEHYPLFAAAFLGLLERRYDGPRFRAVRFRTQSPAETGRSVRGSRRFAANAMASIGTPLLVS